MRSSREALNRLRAELGDLQEARDTVRDLGAFRKYETDPVSFMREVLGAKPWSRQIEIAETVLEHPLVCVQGANGVGKDFTIGQLALCGLTPEVVSCSSRLLRSAKYGKFCSERSVEHGTGLRIYRENCSLRRVGLDVTPKVGSSDSRARLCRT